MSVGKGWWSKWWTEKTFLDWAMKNIILDVAGYPKALLIDGSRQMIDDLRVKYGKKIKLEESLGSGDYVTIEWDDIDWAVKIKDSVGDYVDLYFTNIHGYGSLNMHQDGARIAFLGTSGLIRHGSTTVATIIGNRMDINIAGDISGGYDKTIDMGFYKAAGVAGVDGSFTTVDGKTVTVSKGLITSIV